jgi:hypothetical protein
MTKPTIAGLRADVSQSHKTPAEMLAALEAHLLVVHDALTTADSCMTAQAAELATLRESLAKAEGEARAKERERIARAIEDEAETTPCEEDAAVIAGLATLVRADFSYDEADQYEDKLDASESRAAALQSQVERLAGALELALDHDALDGDPQALEAAREAFASLKETHDV